MPITDLAEAKDLHDEIDRLLNARTLAEAEDILRGIFAWKLDFDPLPPGLTITIRSDQADLPPTATRIATSEGVLVALARLPGEKVTVAATREASTIIGKEVGDHLLVATNASGSVWHFVYLVRRDGRDVRRRIVVERDQPRRTVMEQLAKVFTERRRADLRAALESAFNVDAVTKEFFKEYKSVFDDAMLQVKDSIPEDEPRRLFCQILFNRLMFLYFLQRKGWLRFNGRTDYLQALREASIKAKDDSFYQERLKPLFFKALNTETEARDPANEALLGDVPFLNGGLFEESKEERDYPAWTCRTPRSTGFSARAASSTAGTSRSPKARLTTSKWPSIPKCWAKFSRNW